MKFIQIKDLYLLSVITLIRVVGFFSSLPKIKEFAAVTAASVAHWFSKSKRRLSEKNLSETFGEKLSKNQKQEIIKESFDDFWREVFSLSLSGVERTSLKSAELRGLERLQNALKNGKGVILWESGWFGRRNLAKQILHENGFLLYQVHAEHHVGGFWYSRNSETWVRRCIIEPFFENYEKRFIAEIIHLPNSDSLAFTRHLLDRLKQNAIICIRGDSPYGQKLIPQQFLGRTKLFSTGMVSLAKISGAPILPVFCIRERNGETSLIIERPIRIETGSDREQDLEKSVADYAGLLESYIRKYPEKYRIWHFLGELYDT